MVVVLQLHRGEVASSPLQEAGPPTTVAGVAVTSRFARSSDEKRE